MAYDVEVLKVIKKNGYRTFTIKLTDQGSGEIRVGERMFSPSETPPANVSEVQALADVIWPQFEPERSDDNSTAFNTLKKQYLDVRPTNANISGISDLASAKVVILALRNQVDALAKIVQLEMR